MCRTSQRLAFVTVVVALCAGLTLTFLAGSTRAAPTRPARAPDTSAAAAGDLPARPPADKAPAAAPATPEPVATVAANPTDQVERYSAYEQETVDLTLTAHGGKVDRAPEGKRIEAIDIQVLEVVEDRDPAPGFLNIFHANTQKYVVARELLFEKDQPYTSALIRETERNLRGIRQLSLVLIVPLVGSAPDRVRVLVIAKDIWSLRLNSDYRIKGGALEYLLLQPSEENLAGTHRRISAQFIYEPDTISLGGRFINPRLDGSRILAALDGNGIINHRTGQAEGSFGYFQYGVPVYSTRQEWAWGAVIQWRKEVTRRFIGTQLAGYDADATEEQDGLPFVYNSEIINGRVSVTRSFGWPVKHDFSAGMEFDRRAFRVPHYEPGTFAQAAIDEFEADVVPRSATSNGPFLQYHFHINSFASVLNVETISLQENFRLGPDLYLRFYPVFSAFGSTRDVFGYHGAVAYTQRIGDGLVRVYGAATLESTPDFSRIYDTRFQLGMRAVTPSIGIGRLVFDGTYLQRPHNFSNARVSVGGDGRLRGYPSGQFFGENFVAANTELRTRSFSLWTLQVRGALFYDIADAYDGSELSPKHGAGFGVRVLFPQLDRSVVRVDWGFPLTSADGVFSIFDLGQPGANPLSVFNGLVLTFQQAFGVPQVTGSGVELTP